MSDIALINLSLRTARSVREPQPEFTADELAWFRSPINGGK